MNGTITNEEDAIFVAGKIRDGTLTGEDKDRAFQALNEFRASGYEHTPEEQLNFSQRFGEDLKKRNVMLKDIWEASMPGEDGKIEQGFSEAMLQTIGKVGVGAAFDFIGEALVSGVRGLSTITPDVIEKPIIGTAVNAGHAFLNTPVGLKGLEAAKGGVEKWTEFKAEHPRAARNIESVVNIGLMFVPIKGKPKIKVGGTTTSPSPLNGGTWLTEIGHAGEKIVQSGLNTAAKRKAAYVDDLVLPKPSVAAAEAQVPGTVEGGILRQKKYVLNPAEQAVAAEVRAIPGVSPQKTFQGNWSAINTAVKHIHERLAGLLKKNDVPITQGTIVNRLRRVKEKLALNPLIVGDAARTAEKLMAQAWKLIKENKVTARSATSGKKVPAINASALLKMRTKLDDWVKKQKGNKAFDPKMDSALTIAVREVRGELNDLVAISVPDVAVKASLKRQHLLLNAMENIAPKAAAEGGNMLWRLWRRAVYILPVRSQMTQGLALLLGVGGLGAAAIGGPFVRAAAVMAGTGYFARKVLTSPKLRIAIGNVLKGTDDLIKRYKNDPAALMELRASQALLLEMKKSAEENAVSPSNQE